MEEALSLLERAARCREIAEDYHDEVAAPLVDLARNLEERAQRLQPSLAARVFTGRVEFRAA